MTTSTYDGIIPDHCSLPYYCGVEDSAKEVARNGWNMEIDLLGSLSPPRLSMAVNAVGRFPGH